MLLRSTRSLLKKGWKLKNDERWKKERKREKEEGEHIRIGSRLRVNSNAAFIGTVELIVSWYELLNMDMVWQEGEDVGREGRPGQKAEMKSLISVRTKMWDIINIWS